MSTTPEGRVKKAVCELLDKYKPHVYYFKPAANGYGRAGIPDIIVCAYGQFLAIECKARGNQPTALQQRELAAIQHAGGLTCTIDETNVEVLHILINAMKQRHDRYS